MKRFRNILVALVGTPSDRDTLGWARRIAEAAGAERVNVVILDPEPAEWVPEFPPGLTRDLRKERILSTSEEVAAVFEGFSGPSLHTEASVGDPLPTLLRKLSEGTYDLVVLGAAEASDRNLCEKLARKAPASVLSVPPGSADRCTSILTATDFSEPSRLALELGEAFAKAFDSQRLACLHSFRVPDASRHGAGSQSELASAYRDSASQHLTAFLDRSASGPCPWEPILREAPVASAGVLDELSENPCDLVILATRGRSSIARALLGSNTADVIRRSPVPVLSVKAKGEGLSFLRSLLGGDHPSHADPATSA